MPTKRRLVPTPLKRLPRKLLIEDFTLSIQTFTDEGEWDPFTRRITGVSGTAWLSFGCGSPPTLELMKPLAKEYLPIIDYLEVVSLVTDPQTQVSLEVAQWLKPDIQVGETLELELAVTRDDFRQIVVSQAGIVDWLLGQKKGDVLVQFQKATIQAVSGQPGVGRLVAGQAVYPAEPRIPNVLKLVSEGFTLLIDSFSLSPNGCQADIILQLPGGLGSAEMCGLATLNLGHARITQDCQVYVDRPEATFGPWIVGEAGLVISGKGYTLDLSHTASPPGKPPGWCGLLLIQGEASGSELIPSPCNTGYLAGSYDFRNAEVTQSGFAAHLDLARPHEFRAIQPLGYIIGLNGGYLEILNNRVTSGILGPGGVELPREAVCRGAPGQALRAKFTQLLVQSDLDLAGEVELSGEDLGWGELNHAGAEVMAWQVTAHKGYLYLPAGPVASFSPDDGVGFTHLQVTDMVDSSLLTLESHGVAGVTLHRFDHLLIRSPNRPGGPANPLVLNDPRGWLHVDSRGVDSELWVVEGLSKEPLGDPKQSGYVGNQSFKAELFHSDKQALLAQFATSAVYDSQLYGSVDIPDPCHIPALKFTDMETTSTANLVGGNVTLPVGGVELTYWELQLVPTGDPTQAGVISARTGRIVFTAAGISEPLHFAKPFGLTWGEMLADGNLGELFFDYNCWGQRFDRLPYSPYHISLSQYVAGATDAYLATCGTVHLNFFGPCFANIHDARYGDPNPPYNKRMVTVPKAGEAGCQPTDLHLHNTWNDSAGGDLAIFEFPDVTMDYHEKAQDGFLGQGTVAAGFLHSDGLDAVIEIHASSTDIGLSSTVTHDLDLDLFTRLGALNNIWGCIRIEGPLITRMAITGYLEVSAIAGTGILEPRGAVAAEVNITTTASSLDLYVSGEMFLTVAGCGIDVSASAHLFFDYLNGSAEGDLQGRLDCTAIIGGLAGEGQVSWYIDANTQYLQGRMKMAICSWAGGVGLEGGLFLGHQVPKAKAWVLYSGGERFGISDAVLPALLTGAYGYGQIGFGVNWYIFGGGVEIYAGMGAFTDTPPGLGSAIAGLALPYVLGSCGIHVYGEILGGLVSASAWAALSLRGPVPLYFEGSFGLEGCVVWVICASIDVTAGISSEGFYIC